MKIGFIGCGNMATAILKGILKCGEVKKVDMIASAKSEKTEREDSERAGDSACRKQLSGIGVCRCGFSGCKTTVSGRCAG